MSERVDGLRCPAFEADARLFKKAKHLRTC